MPMPMQISLDEVLSMLLARVDSLAMNDENNKTKFNVIARVLYKKGLLTDQEVLESVQEEHRMLKELGLIASEPPAEMAQAIADSLLQWIKGDVAGLKKSMEDYEKKLQEYAREEAAKKPKIEVAGANVLNQLDAAAAKGGSKLII